MECDFVRQSPRDAFKHCKTIGAEAGNLPVVRIADPVLSKLLGEDTKALIKVVGQGRHWIREAVKPL